MRTSQLNWTSYLWTGAIIFVASWAAAILSGCRFGNRVESEETLSRYTGYYETQPTALIFCAYLPDQTCAAAPLESIPSLVRTVMTDPVILSVDKSGSALFVSHDLKSDALPVNLSSDLKLTMSGATPSKTFWKDTKCTTQSALYEEGELQLHEPRRTAADGKPLSGRVRIDTMWADFADGGADCEPTLQAIAACYQDVSQCLGATDTENTETQLRWRKLFGPYIDHGVMTVADIERVRAVAYQVSFQ